MSLTSEHIEHFERDGFVVVRDALSSGDVHAVLSAMERVYAGQYTADRRPPRVRRPVTPMGSQESVHWILNARVLDPELWRIATHPALGEIAATLLRSSSVSIIEDQLLAKPPQGLPVNIHQDYSYWPFSRSAQMITGWFALVDMTLDMGPLQVLPGSHRWGTGGRPKELIRGSAEGWLAALEGMPQKDAALEPWTAQISAGDAVFFHGLTFHGSPANESTRWRRAYSLHWAASECRVDLGATAKHDFPYFFARLTDGGPLVNDYMPVVYDSGGERRESTTEREQGAR